MEIREVNRKLKEYKYVKRLIQSSFPDYELYPYWLMMVNAKRKLFDYNAFYDNGTFVGALYTAVREDFVYIFYIVIDDKLRGCGYGSRILSCIKNKYPDKNIVLDMEPLDESADNYEERINRVQFYEKNGFELSGWALKGKEINYSIMSTKALDAPQRYVQVYTDFVFGRHKAKVVKE